MVRLALLKQALEMPPVALGCNNLLLATTANATQSQALCKLIHMAVQGHATHRFDYCLLLLDKGFGMVTNLCG